MTMNTTAKTYSNRSNCMRAARVGLSNPRAMPDVDFTLTGSGKEWCWTPIIKAKAPKAEKAPKEKRTKQPRGANIANQPAMVALLNLMLHAPIAGGELAAKLGCEPHTARGSISRLRAAGCNITSTREGRIMLYRFVPGRSIPVGKAAAGDEDSEAA
jgi:biotin operon repressor